MAMPEGKPPPEFWAASSTDREHLFEQRSPVVLLMGDQPLLALSLESVLSSNDFVVMRASRGKRALRRIDAAHVDVVIILAELIDGTGIELCRIVRAESDISATTPVVLVTSASCNREHRLKALRAGAWECVGFPLNLEELLLKLKLYVGAKLEADRAREESLLDAATGLYNMNGLMRRFRELAYDAGQNHRALACAAIAVEESPRHESRLHSAELIRQRTGDDVAKLLTSVSRGSDTIGRLSQTEFALLAVDKDESGIRRMAQRFVDAAKLGPSEDARLKKSRRVCIGCCAVEDFSQAFIEPGDLLMRATMALRRIQNDGDGEPIQFYESSTPTLVHH